MAHTHSWPRRNERGIWTTNVLASSNGCECMPWKCIPRKIVWKSSLFSWWPTSSSVFKALLNTVEADQLWSGHSFSSWKTWFFSFWRLGGGGCRAGQGRGGNKAFTRRGEKRGLRPPVEKLGSSHGPYTVYTGCPWTLPVPHTSALAKHGKAHLSAKQAAKMGNFRWPAHKYIWSNASKMYSYMYWINEQIAKYMTSHCAV